jgi:quercetin dioxygenase-like cupin family protein
VPAAADIMDMELDFVTDQVARLSFVEEDFLFEFDGTPAEGPGGQLILENIGANPILATLPDGGAQALVTLNPCGLVAPHHHPGGTEFLHVISGSLEVTIIEENGGRALVNKVDKGRTVILPRGAS